MRIINFFFIALLVPFLGLLGGAYLALYENDGLLPVPFEKLEPVMTAFNNEALAMEKNIGFIRQTAAEQQRQFAEHERILKELAQKSGTQKKLSDAIYEQRILERLGPPIGQHRSERVEIKVFQLKELGYRGYIAKIKLFDPSAFKVVLGKGKLGESEITSAAVKRTGAILGINGGGFFRMMQDGKEYTLPIGNTVVNGKLVGGFKPSHKDLFFAGVDNEGELLGGIFYEKDALMQHRPVAGVSFVPALIKNRKPLPIPEKWQHKKEPRTIIGEYGNDDLILIVVDGRQSDWSSGVTLEHLQIKLIELGVIEAYNLDGGGSSAFVFNGEVLNRPSDGKERPVATNIVVMP
ncbi:phosphodiester glycosidase family protein [Desulfoscipio geothermicus]|uniref:Exopolysaccharide biosynthesis protein n=1 Tax=Desulfoscipio geothermicus DSM 3669 TaxID=1121426 RepID=A0A1I6E057_9FIRM|nr:phosphodiester glycosidase family protein [Desulfoscipio geothermicus]SFR11007.1 Exopolysaccharide biosynthesis protein [Desulfoscipio geothermicus DSM 3669]